MNIVMIRLKKFYLLGSRAFWRSSKKWERKFSLLIAFFYELLPRTTTDKRWNVSKMRFLHVKVAKSDAQWTELKALKCWSHNKTKLEVWGQDSDSSHVRHIALLEIVALANSKKNRNIKANDVNLISMARSSDFCFKTTYVCFCAYDRLRVTFSVLFVVRHPLEKLFPMNPLPLGNSCRWTPSPPWNFQRSSVRGGGYGYFLEPHIITESMLTGKCHNPSQSLNPLGPKSDQHQFSPDNIRPWLFKRWITLSIR